METLTATILATGAVDHAAVLEFLAGEWMLTREVPGQATMAGSATIAAAGEGAAEYAESVEVHLADGHVLHGEQRYRYELTLGGLAVYFHPSATDAAEGPRRLFHLLHFTADERGALRADATHLCSADAYQSSYVIESNDSFTVRHEVRGPHKDYVLHSRYQRLRV